MRFSSYLTTALTAIGLVAFSVQAADFTWVGTSTAWATAGNWTPGGGPPNDSGDTALIPDASTTSFDPLISTTLTVGSIHVDDDGVMSIGNSGVLTVTDITVDDLGSFAMTGSASVDLTGTLTVDGGYAMSGTSVLNADNIHILNGGEVQVGSGTNAEVQDSAGLTVDTGGVLDVIGTFEVTGGGIHLVSGTGMIELSASGATLKVYSASATIGFSGTVGTILASDNAAVIDVAAGILFTSDVLLQGGADFTGSGTFVNSDIVTAHSGMTISMPSTLNLADAAGSVWEADGGTLVFNKVHTGNSALKGDLGLYNEGTLDFNESVTFEVPSGGVATFDWSNGTLDVASDKTLTFESSAGACGVSSPISGPYLDTCPDP